MTMNFEQMVDFVKKSDIENQLYVSAKYLLKNKDFELHVEGLSSHTNGKEIVIGLPFGLVQISNEEELFVFLMASMGHEVQHMLSSPTKEIEKAHENIVNHMREKKINRSIASNIAYSILNCLEDARIENILVNNKKGFLKYIRYMRYKYYTSYEVEKDELYDFLNSIYIYSTTGFLPTNFKEIYSNTKLEKEFNKIKNYIDKAVYLKTCKECMQLAEKVGNEIIDYIKELVGEDEEIEEAKMLHKKTSSGEEEKELNNKNENSSKINNISPNENSEQNDENINNELDEAFKEAFNKLKESMNKNNKNKSTDQKKTTQKSQMSMTNRDSRDIENYYVGKGAAPDSLIKVKKASDNNNQKINEKVELPLDIKKRASKFNREVIEIMEDKKKPLRRNQKRGTIDTNSLYRFDIFDDADIFIKKSRTNELNTVFYFLVDGSGSMKDNNKWKYAVETMAVLEEALKEIVKIKVVVFNTDWKSTQHIVIKDFDDNIKNKNLIYTNYKNKYIKAGGANKDGANIRLAIKELEKRNDKQKVLFVLSDGMPSAYQYNGKFAIKDVKDAVKEARSKNIEVISIMFGSTKFRRQYYDLYKQMYEKNIISTEPSQIFSKIIRVLKDIFANI